MYNMSANNTKNTKSTTIRVSQETKDELENLDFVKKDTFDSIIHKLIDFYENKPLEKVSKNQNKKKVGKK